MRTSVVTTVVLTLAGAGSALAQDPLSIESLSQLTIEELSQIPINSVSKRDEPIAEAPAAVYVIAAEDIRRSGAPSLPEALRLAPNLSVQRLNALDYAISARGFNGFEQANKLLVLVDGRSVYTPLHSGVFWSSVPVMLGDIERIEVISGPGGTLWGANAVNGVINIVTRSAVETQGGLIEAGGGNIDADGAVRYGGRLGASGGWRVFGQYYERDAPGAEGWNGAQGGFRLDWGEGPSVFTVQGDASRVNRPGQIEEVANLIGRWTRTLEGGGILEAQAYADQVVRDQSPNFERTTTGDLQLQHVLSPKGRHQLVWGAGYRLARDEFRTTQVSSTLDPLNRSLGLGNVFVQDEIALTDRLSAVVGLKLEHSTFTGAEYLPSGRIAWRPTDRALLWAAVSRAVRTPSRIERELVSPGFLVKADFQSETLVAYEAGYRGRPTENLQVSVSAYYNVYDNLRTAELTPPGALPIFFANGGEGETWGVEAWADYAVNDRWRLSAGVATFESDLETPPGSLDITGLISQGFYPDYVAKLSSKANLTPTLDLDVRLRAAGELEFAGLPDYLEADVRLAWRPAEGLELALSGFNLLDAAHPETVYPTAVEVVRSFRLSARKTF